MAITSEELLKDVGRVIQKLDTTRVSEITLDPVFMYPGALGANFDASGSSRTLERGWGQMSEGVTRTAHGRNG